MRARRQNPLHRNPHWSAQVAQSNMERSPDTDLTVRDVSIEGYAQPITLRTYRLSRERASLPIVVYFHGGSFTQGSLEDADAAARALALHTPAWVVSVGYSLAPAFPFPAAPEDAYQSLAWTVSNARGHRGDARRIAVAGHDAGGNLATVVAAMARDRGDIHLVAQIMLAPLLDPSMTRIPTDSTLQSQDQQFKECSRCYRAYLPAAMHRLHPYAAPLESSRLSGLPPALIATAHRDILHVEAETYAAALIAAGVPTEVTRHPDTTHDDIATHPKAMADVVNFLQRRLSKATSPLAV
jgi:acetyl esterase